MVRLLPRMTLAPLVCLSSAMLVLLVSELFDQKYQKIEEARTHYSAALAETRNLLASHLYFITSDATVADSLKGGLFHTLQQNLLGRLHHGQIEQLAVFDQNCQELARASLNKVPFLVPCSASAASSQFHWEKAPNQDVSLPVLALSQRVGAERGLLFQAQVPLSQSWLLLYPDLAKDFKSLSLSLGSDSLEPNQGVLLVKEGKSNQGRFEASLWSSDPLVVHAFAFVGNQRNINLLKNSLFWPLCFFALAFMMYERLLARGQRRRDRNAGEHYLVQCERLLTYDAKVLHYDPERDTELKHYPQFRLGLSVMIQALKKNYTRSEQLSAERDRFQDLAEKLVQQRRRLEKSLGELCEHDTLAIQIKQSAQTFMQRLKEQQLGHKNLLQLLKKGLVVDAGKMLELLNEWKLGMQEKGVRKWIRSLSETPGASRDGSLLEDKVSLFLDMGNRMVDQSFYVCQIVQKLAVEQAKEMQVLAHWYGLALRGEQEGFVEQASVKHALVQAEEMRLLGEQSRAVRSQSALHLQIQLEDQHCPFPQVPVATLQAAFFHALSAFATAVRSTEPGRIVVRAKTLADEQYLLFTLVGWEFAMKNREDEGWLHFHRVQNLLTLHQITFQPLPTEGRLDTFVFKWKLQSLLGTTRPTSRPDRGRENTAST